MVKRVMKYFVLLLLLSINLSAQSISVLASIDSSDYLVGDDINYTLEIRAENNIELTTPIIRDSLKKVEIIKEMFPLFKDEETIKVSTFGYIISYYDYASITIPPSAVRYKIQGVNEEKITLSNPVTFTVHTMQVEQQADIKDVKEPLTIPLDWKFILLIVLIVLIVIAAAYYMYRRYKKKKAEQPVKKKILKIRAHVRALTALDNLENEKIWQKGMVKEYHSNITGIIRDYFEERFNLPALELTTSEQMQVIDRMGQSSGHALEQADLIVLATPVGTFEPIVREIAPHLKNGAILTDVGSVKGGLVRTIEGLLPAGVHYVPGHPIAGREKHGVDAATETLFQGAKCVLTPTERTDVGALEAVKALWSSAGMQIITMHPDSHDHIFAAVGHLPHAGAYAVGARSRRSSRTRWLTRRWFMRRF